MADQFANAADTVTAPATRVAPVVPSDTVALTDIPKALYVGTGGALAIEAARGGSASFRVGDGTVLPVRARLVKATGTTAADIVALF